MPVVRRRRYPSDLTTPQWELIEPLLPAVNHGGRPEKHPRRAVVDAVLYVVRTGCSWRKDCGARRGYIIDRIAHHQDLGRREAKGFACEQ